jgi:transitional endoplasmic reticulum ATPase
MPLDRLRNRQSGKHAHDTVEAPEVIAGKEDITLFQQIARHPGKLNFGIIGGLEQPIEEMRRLIVISKHSEEFTRRGINHPNCVLLYGPPGTGKSLLAEVAAKELDGHYLKIDCSDILNKWVGESETRIRAIFRLIARLSKDKPVTVFFDEFDTLGSKKKESSPEWMKSIVNTMLTALSELPRNCIAIAAVNDIDALEPAIKREGRFSRIAVNPPNAAAREAIITNWIRHFNEQPAGTAFDAIDVPKIVAATDGFCGADIQSLLSRVITNEVISQLQEERDPKPSTQKDVMHALQVMKDLKGKDADGGSHGQYL